MAESKKPAAKPAAAKKKPAAKPSRKTKSYVLIRPIDGVFARTDETSATFHAEEVGLTYTDDDPAVAKAVAMNPDCFTAG